MQPVEPVIVVGLFQEERRHLLELFAELLEEDWERPTVCQGWTVKDIGLHLLGDDIGFLSGRRDSFSNPFFYDKDMHEWENLVENINEANEMWVRATERISPQLLSSLLEWTGKQFSQYMQSLDQMEVNGAVSWAGLDHAPIWLDTAREYTERWLHQQQIRDAVDKPGLKERRFFHPVLNTFLWALPQTYKDVAVADMTVIKLVITGEAGDSWYLMREANAWHLYKVVEQQPSTVITMDGEICWRLFTKGISKDVAQTNTLIEGDKSLGEKIFDTVSIIA